MNDEINIKVSNYFPFNFTIVGYGALVAGLIATFSSPIAAVVFLLLGVVFVSSHYRLKINLKDRYFREYLWLLGYKTGPRYRFESASYIYINEARRDFEYGSIAVRRYGREYVHKAYIRFVGQEEPAYIGCNRNYYSILNKSKKVSHHLGIPIKSDGNE